MVSSDGVDIDLFDEEALEENYSRFSKSTALTKDNSILPLLIIALIYLIIAVYIGTPILWYSLMFTILVIMSIVARKNNNYSLWLTLVLLFISISFFLSIADRFSISYNHALALGVVSLIIIVLIVTV